jgi:hypothetical protein
MNRSGRDTGMTTPDRSISGLSPRRPKPDASRLIAANRPAPSIEPESEEPAPGTDAMTQAPSSVSSMVAPSGKGDPSAPIKVSVYLPKGFRRIAVAAFKATAHLEGDQSWSHMVEKAIRAEVTRRENTYNGGLPFPGGEGKLTPGRSVAP